jgi:hypothetical protein
MCGSRSSPGDAIESDFSVDDTTSGVPFFGSAGFASVVCALLSGITVIVGVEEVAGALEALGVEGAVLSTGACAGAGVEVGCCARAIDPERVRTTAIEDRMRMEETPGRAAPLPSRRSSLLLL